MTSDSKEMLVRRLAPFDAPQYRELMLEAYAAHPEAFTSTAAERAELPMEWWQSRLMPGLDAAEVVIGACHGEHLVGAVGLKFDSRKKIRHKATLYGMYLQPDARRAGIGAKLVHAALAHAQERDGVKLVQLTVTQGNLPAEALYAACGFLRFGLEPYAVEVDSGFVSKVHMWRALCDDALPDGATPLCECDPS